MNMKTGKSRMVAFRCPEELVKAAAELAEHDDRSLSNLLKHLLKDAVERFEQEESKRKREIAA